LLHHTHRVNLTRPLKSWALLCLLLICFPVSAWGGYPKNAHAFAPKDASLYLEINHLNQWLGHQSHNPLVSYLRTEVNVLHANEAWKKIHSQLGLTSEQMITHYLGEQTAVIFSQTTNKPQQSFIVMKSDPKHQQLIIKKLNLNRINTLKVDQYNIYQTHQKDSYIAVGYDKNPWIAICHPKSKLFMLSQLRGFDIQNRLVNNPEFKSFIKKNANQKHVLFYTHSDQTKQSLAFTAHQNKKTFLIEFTVSLPETLKAIYQNLEKDIRPGDFCPLPLSTAIVGSFNAKQLFPKEQVAFFDQLLKPDKFSQRVAPHIQAPIVYFAGKADKGRLALGLALKVSDKNASFYLHRLLDRLTQRLNQNDNKKSKIQKETYLGHTLYTHSLTIALLKQLGLDSHLFSSITFGQIGQWFYISTSPQFHRSCIDVAKDPTQNLSNKIKSNPELFKPKTTNLLSIYIKSSSLQKMISDFVQIQKKSNAKAGILSFKKTINLILPNSPESRLLLALDKLSQSKLKDAIVSLQIDLPAKDKLSGRLIFHQPADESKETTKKEPW